MADNVLCSGWEDNWENWEDNWVQPLLPQLPWRMAEGACRSRAEAPTGRTAELGAPGPRRDEGMAGHPLQMLPTSSAAPLRRSCSMARGLVSSQPCVT